MKSISMTAIAALSVAAAGFASAAAAEVFTINVEIAPFATIQVTSGTVLNLTPNSLNTDDSNEGDGPVLPFTVLANGPYELSATFNTFQPSFTNGAPGAPTYQQAQFVSGSNRIGGSIFFGNENAPGPMPNGSNTIVRQNSAGVLFVNPTAQSGGGCTTVCRTDTANGGPDVWGLGASVGAQYSESTDGLTGFADPPAGTYSLDVDVVVTPVI